MTGLFQIAGLLVLLDQQEATAPAAVKAEFMQALGSIATAREARPVGMAASLLAGAIVSNNRETVAACKMSASAGSPKKYAGIKVSLEESCVCAIDASGKIVGTVQPLSGLARIM